MLGIVKTYENVKLQEIVVADEDFIVKYTHDTEFYNSDNYKIPYYELRDIPFESTKKDKSHSKKIKFGKIGDRYFISGDRFHIYLIGNVMRIRAESYKHEFSTDEHIKYLTLLSGNCYVPEYIALRFFLALAPHRIMPDTIKRIFQF